MKATLMYKIVSAGLSFVLISGSLSAGKNQETLKQIRYKIEIGDKTQKFLERPQILSFLLKLAANKEFMEEFNELIRKGIPLLKNLLETVAPYQLKEMSDTNKARLEAQLQEKQMKLAHEAQLKQKKLDHEAKLKQAELDYKTKIEQKRLNHEAKLKQKQLDHDAKLEQMKLGHKPSNLRTAMTFIQQISMPLAIATVGVYGIKRFFDAE